MSGAVEAAGSAMPGGTRGPRPHERIDDALLARWRLPPVDGDGDKEARGRVLVVAGSREIAGAAILAGIAALRAGAGKLAIATPASAWALVAGAVPEARVIALPETAAGGPAPGGLDLLAKCMEGSAAILVGPGMMDADATTAFTRELVARSPGTPIVLDALAMDAVREGAAFGQPVLLTPHAGEMAHLSGIDKAEIERDGSGVALQHAAQWNAVLALKGASTWIAQPDGSLWLHEADVPGLATSGSGDVLAGIVAGLLARGAAPAHAAAWGVVLHARAGQRLARERGPVGYLARELAAEVPALMAAFAA